MALLEVKGLRTYYYTYRGVVKAVDNVSFEVEKGETLGLAGESGCGKSTAAYSIIKLVPPPGRIVGGSIIFDGMDITKMSEKEVRDKIRWKRISMVFQGAMNALTPVYTVQKQIVEVLTYHAKMDKKAAIERAAELLEMVGLDRTVLRRYPHELSGGMKQRAFIAMALALNPDLLIADEPTTALDVVVQAQILNLMKRLQKEFNLSLILITHDLSVTAEMSDKVAIMYAGKVVEYGPSELIFREPLHPYSEGLIMSIPSLRNPRKVKWIPGLPPDLVEPPPGCRFHPRCPHAMDRCKKEEPPLVEERGRKVACWLYAG